MAETVQKHEGKHGVTFLGTLSTGPYSSLMRVDVWREGRDGKLKKVGHQRILGISHQREVVRVGLFRRKAGILRFDPVSRLLSVDR